MYYSSRKHRLHLIEHHFYCALERGVLVDLEESRRAAPDQRLVAEAVVPEAPDIDVCVVTDNRTLTSKSAIRINGKDANDLPG